MSIRSDSTDNTLIYVVYDRKSGRPVGRHRQYNAVERKLEAVDEADLLSLYHRNKDILRRVTDNDPGNLAIMKLSQSSGQSLRNMQVHNAQLVPRQKLVIFSDKDELEGDGQDVAQLSIMLQDETGGVATTAFDTILVTTSRGKLSARGGKLNLEKGRATLTLTSVPETVNKVRVTVKVIDALAEPAELRLAFV